jgi:hypothetical protein
MCIFNAAIVSVFNKLGFLLRLNPQLDILKSTGVRNGQALR